MRHPHGGAGEALARVFPEKTIGIRSGTAVRCFRLSSRAQAALATGLCLSTLWTLTATGLVAVESWQRMNGGLAVEQIARTYEARIAELEGERASLLRARDTAERQSEAALAALAARHDAVSAGLASEKALSASLESLRLRVATLAAERDGLLATAAASSARISELGDLLARAETDRRDLSETLHRVAMVLDATADARDGALAEAVQAEGALGELEAGVEQQRDLQTRLIAQIEDAAERSIGPLEKLFGSVGIDVDELLRGMRSSENGRGGPFIPAPETIAALPPTEGERLVSVLSRLERVALLKRAAERLPFGHPTAGLRKTSGFGLRRDPFNGRRSSHEGVDFAGPVGAPIRSPAEGTVVFSGVQRGYGRLVKIRHANGFETVYAHLSRSRVRVGQTVKRGDLIANVGNTGRSTGPHLHYEIRYNGRPINPMKFIEAARHVL